MNFKPINMPMWPIHVIFGSGCVLLDPRSEYQLCQHMICGNGFNRGVPREGILAKEFFVHIRLTN